MELISRESINCFWSGGGRDLLWRAAKRPDERQTRNERLKKIIMCISPEFFRIKRKQSSLCFENVGSFLMNLHRVEARQNGNMNIKRWYFYKWVCFQTTRRHICPCYWRVMNHVTNTAWLRTKRWLCQTNYFLLIKFLDLIRNKQIRLAPKRFSRRIKKLDCGLEYLGWSGLVCTL